MTPSRPARRAADCVRVEYEALADARVSGVVLDEVRGPRVKVFKMKRRKGYRRTRGHRQNLLRVRISDMGGRALDRRGAQDWRGSNGSFC